MTNKPAKDLLSKTFSDINKDIAVRHAIIFQIINQKRCIAPDINKSRGKQQLRLKRIVLFGYDENGEEDTITNL